MYSASFYQEIQPQAELASESKKKNKTVPEACKPCSLVVVEVS